MTIDGLQWGRVLMNAETPSTMIASPTRTPASMGPRSHERGNVILVGAAQAGEALQWGRVLMNAETDRSTTLCEIKAFSLVIERSLYARARTGSWAASSWLKPLVVKEHERRRALGHHSAARIIQRIPLLPVDRVFQDIGDLFLAVVWPHPASVS